MDREAFPDVPGGGRANRAGAGGVGASDGALDAAGKANVPEESVPDAFGDGADGEPSLAGAESAGLRARA